MSLSSALNGVSDFIVANMSGFDASSVSVGDEGVFRYIQSDSTGDKKCVVVSPDLFASLGRSEQMSASINWSVGVNAFFMIPDDDIASTITDAIGFTDDFILALIQNPTLSGAVMSAKITRGGPLMTYRRGNFYYFLMPLTVTVLDNIS